MCMNTFSLKGRINWQSLHLERNPITLGRRGPVWRGVLDSNESVVLKECATADLVLDDRTDSRKLLLARNRHVTRFFGMTQDSFGRFYTATEYAPFGSLADALKNHLERKDSRLLLRWAIHLIRGLQYLHYKSILHLNVKPQNVLMFEGNVVKICDYDLSTLHLDPVEARNINASVRYLAPEQSDADFGDVSSATDVFGVGGVLFAMTMRAEPWEGLSAAKILMKHAKREHVPFPPVDLQDSILVGMAGLSAQCLHPDPLCRPSLAQVLKELRALLLPTSPGRPVPPKCILPRAKCNSKIPSR